MRSFARARNASRRVVGELLLIGVVMVAGAQLPLQDEPGTSWAFLTPVGLFVAHSVLGVLILVDGVRLVAWSHVLGGRAVTQAGIGLVVCLLAVGAGVASMANAGPDDVRPAMALAWVVGLGVYSRLWWASSEALQSGPGSLPSGT
jgi:hypothetical protein